MAVVRRMFLVPIILSFIFAFPAFAKQKGGSKGVLEKLRQNQGYSSVYDQNKELAEALAALPPIQDGINEEEESALVRIAKSLSLPLEGSVLEGTSSAAYLDEIITGGPEAVNHFYSHAMGNPAQSNPIVSYINHVAQEKDNLVKIVGNELHPQLPEELQKTPEIKGYN